ncbi:MAG: hypothetical protein J7551_00170 [Chloroflexi bacterium]|nr:hypothetical protein [Chloroflexota bacterium]
MRVNRWLTLWAALAILPILNAVHIMLTYSTNSPYIEEWFDSALTAIAVHDGTLTLGQLLTPVYEHPHLFTKLMVALHTPLTRYNLQFDMLLSLLMNGLILASVLWLVWRQDRRLALWLALPLSALIFTPKQAINWLVGFQNNYFAFTLCVVAVLLIIQVTAIGWRPLLLAAFIGVLGSIGLGAAPMFWLPPVITLWLRGYRRWQHYAVWFVISTIMIVRFVVSTRPGSPPSLNQLGLIAHFTVAFLSAPLAPVMHLIAGTPVGILGLLMFAFNALLLRRRPEWLASWAGLAAFSVLSAFMTAYARWIFFDGVSAFPLNARYVTNGVPFWVALLVVSASNLLLWRQPSVRWLYRLNALAGIGLSAVFLASLVLVRLPDYMARRACLRELPVTRDLNCAKDLAAGRSNLLPVLVRADQLAVRRLSIFAQEPPVVPRFGEVAVPLQFIGDGWPSGRSPETRFTTWEINGERHNVLLQQPPAMQDWTVWFQHITAPAYLAASLYVAPGEQPSEGVTFRIYGQLWLQERKLLFEQHFDPRTQREPVPIRVSLAPFMNQRNLLMIILETETSDASYNDRAMWIEPRFVLELSEEAARAPYYPPH